MKQLEKWVKEGSVDTVVVAGIDLQGRLYGKRCAAIPFLRDLAGGVHTCDCNFGWDIERMLISGLKFTGWHTGYGDMTLVPDWTTLRKIPWFEKTALVVCDTYDHLGHLVDIAPRTMLRKQIEKAKKLGFDVKAAPELEFFLFRETLESSRAKDYRDLEPMSRYISDYSIFRSSMDEWIIGPMRRNLAEAGIEPSVGSTGDSYDNALAETINGLYKAEIIHRRGPWKTREAVELATLEWVSWFNHHRLLEPIGYIPPAEAEAHYWRQQAQASAPTKPARSAALQEG